MVCDINGEERAYHLKRCIWSYYDVAPNTANKDEVDPYYTLNIKRKGHCQIEMKFAKPLPESVTLMLCDSQHLVFEIRVCAMNQRPTLNYRYPLYIENSNDTML